MRRLVPLLLLAVLVFLLARPVAAQTIWLAGCHGGKHAIDSGAARPFLVCLPSRVRKGAPVVVYLHGCTQTAEDARFGTRFDALGEELGFITVFPQQSTTANGTQCWNWFLPDNWVREGEEPAIIAGITQAVVDRYAADPNEVYIAGASAGGSMAGIMAATYPDLYAALGILAAPAFAGDPSGTSAFEAMGDYERPIPTLIFQGTADAVVDYPTGRSSLYQWTGTNDWADDGALNGSVPAADPDPEVVPATSSPTGPSSDPDAGCVAPPRGFPCIGPLLGLTEYPHTIERLGSGDTTVEFWTIQGLAHAYPGGYQGEPGAQESNKGTFTDPTGPSFTQVAFDFFMSHPMPEED